jgi:hypothetical protein
MLKVIIFDSAGHYTSKSTQGFTGIYLVFKENLLRKFKCLSIHRNNAAFDGVADKIGLQVNVQFIH